MAYAHAAPAAAFDINLPRTGPTATEYYNTHLDHYFLTIDNEEMAAIEAGAAGPGWIRTGLAFHAYGPDAGSAGCRHGCIAQVSRFYGTPGLGPNSHFYTGFSDEAAILRRPGTGWSFERVEFSIMLPDAGGRCATGLAPVYRLYNGRWRVNDSNHRFVASAAERDRMIARGWIDEGVAFCAERALEVPVKSLGLAFGAATAKVRPSAECENESLNLGPCVAINNLPVPGTMLGPYIAAAPQAFIDRTGYGAAFAYVVDGGDVEKAAANVFVQPNGGDIGIHVESRDRGASPLSSVNPLYQLRSSAAPGAFDARFFPFGPAESALELRVGYGVLVKRLEARNAQSHAYGHPTLEFMDRKSGRNLYFTAGTYGTVAPGGTFLAVDETTGKVIVGTSLEAGSPYLRNLGLAQVHLPRSFVSPSVLGTGGAFEFRVDRAEFQRVIDAARTLQPDLSADPADYLIDNFHFNNEVVGDGEIGLRLSGFRVELVRKPAS